MPIRIEIKGNRAVLMTAIDPGLMALCRTALEGKRKWLLHGGLSFEPTPHNLDVLSEAFDGALEIEDQNTVERLPESARKRTSYRSRTKPYPLQARALEAMRGRETFALFAEQGTGKTKIAIDYAADLYAAGHIDAVLVVAPKGVHAQWAASEIEKHCGLPHYNVVCWPACLTKEEMDGDPDALWWWTMNYDILRMEGRTSKGPRDTRGGDESRQGGIRGVPRRRSKVPPDSR